MRRFYVALAATVAAVVLFAAPSAVSTNCDGRWTSSSSAVAECGSTAEAWDWCEAMIAGYQGNDPVECHAANDRAYFMILE